jgi:citrate synthase
LIDGDLRASARREIAKSLAALVLLLDIGEAGSVEGAADPRSAARYLIQTVAGCFCWIGDRPFAPRRPREGLAAYALRSAGSAATPRATRALEAALIALADNALAPATYAALVLASTGVGLNAGISAALSSNETTGLGQVFQVGEKMALELMNRDIQSERVIREYAGRLLANQRNKRGDGRVRIILAAARSLGGAAFSEAFVRLERIRSLTGVHANLNVALGLLALALGLPARSTPMIWTLGRMAGWCSHIIEQSGQGAGEAA